MESRIYNNEEYALNGNDWRIMIRVGKMAKTKTNSHSYFCE